MQVRAWVGHLEPIKTRHIMQVSVIPALVPRDRKRKQNCKLTGQLTWHTPWKKTARRPGLQRVAARADTEAVLWSLQRNHTTHEWVCAHTPICEVQFSPAEMWSFFISLSFWNIIFSFMITSYYLPNQKDCMLRYDEPWKDSERKKPGTQRPYSTRLCSYKMSRTRKVTDTIPL